MSENTQSAESGGSLALVCPYCGATVSINLETVGPAYLTHERPESIECYASDCEATWEPNGEPRDAPRWERCPGLHDAPKRAGEREHQRTGWRLYNDLVDRHNVERLHLQAVIDELKDLLSRACAQDATEDCWFDHNGGCQAHGFLSGACPYPLIRQYVDPTYSTGQADH